MPVIRFAGVLFSSYSLVTIEAVTTLAGFVLLLLWRRQFAGRRGRKIGSALYRLARHQTWSICICGAAVLILRLVLWPFLPMPRPGVHDEFSYLLAADTFASGRLANPPHPLWVHFETFHVNFLPTYSSIYPPAQGLVLAASKRLHAPAWMGIWITSAVLAGAICWMIQGWLPPPWPLIGGLIAVMRVCTFSYWVNSYWGGALAALAGALVAGSLPRLRRHPTVLNSLILGAGISLLSATRPYEGLAFSLPAFAILARWTVTGDPIARILTYKKVVLPLGLVLLIAACFTGCYWAGVTGSPWTMPQQVNAKRYAKSSAFVWQSAPPTPRYNHRVMEMLYQQYFDVYRRTRTWSGFVSQLLKKVVRFWLFFLGPALSVPLLASCWILKPGRFRLLLWFCAATFGAIFLEVYFLPHYAAATLAPLYVILLQCMRHLVHWRVHGHVIGPPLVQVAGVVCGVMWILCALALALGLPVQTGWAMTWCQTGGGNVQRDSLIRSLEKAQGQHLIIVQYDAWHDPHQEWVYNGADIDRASVVWARDMGASKNEELIRYFQNRRVWLFQPDRNPEDLIPYEPAMDGVKAVH